jgi:hypothetical protein
MQCLHKYDDYLSVGGLPDAVFARKEGRDWESALDFILASQVEDFLRIEKLKMDRFQKFNIGDIAVDARPVYLAEMLKGTINFPLQTTEPMGMRQEASNVHCRLAFLEKIRMS